MGMQGALSSYKPILMSTVKEMRSQLELWRQYFLDTQHEINDLQEKTALYLSLHHKKKDATDAEAFLNQFISQQEAILRIMERLKECDDALNGENPDKHIEDGQVTKCTNLDQDMDVFQNVYNVLKENLKQRIK
jgi:hypothetical protein